MKHSINKYIGLLSLLLLTLLMTTTVYSQDEASSDDKPVRWTFASALIIDNQSVMVPIKGTFEFDIMHRFGTFSRGYSDFFGLYSNSNIRLGLNYAPINDLYVGFGLTKFKHLLDLNVKYALLKQTRSGSMPLSVTYFGNMAIDTRPDEDRDEVYNSSDRYSYFHQLIIARKFNDWLSLQVAPSLSHYNIIPDQMQNDHIAIAVNGQIGVTQSIDVIFGYDQPITKHDQNNPNPNLSLGIQMSTSSHAFQIFIGNYNSILPQENNFFNANNYEDGFKNSFLIGFNITRLWNF